MKSSSPVTIQHLVRRARQDRDMTQGQLAELIGVSQPTISTWERGRDSALSDEKIERAAELLDIDLDDIPDAKDEREALEPTLRFCPNYDCISNLPYLVAGALHVLPGFVELPKLVRTKCLFCNEVLIDQCSCGASIEEPKAYCECGRALVKVTANSPEPTEAWVAERMKIHLTTFDRLNAR